MSVLCGFVGVIFVVRDWVVVSGYTFRLKLFMVAKHRITSPTSGNLGWTFSSGKTGWVLGDGGYSGVLRRGMRRRPSTTAKEECRGVYTGEGDGPRRDPPTSPEKNKTWAKDEDDSRPNPGRWVLSGSGWVGLLCDCRNPLFSLKV